MAEYSSTQQEIAFKYQVHLLLRLNLREGTSQSLDQPEPALEPKLVKLAMMAIASNVDVMFLHFLQVK